LVAVAASAALAAGAWGATRSPLLDVDDVVVAGTAHMTEGEVLGAAGIHHGDAMVDVGTSAAEARLRRLPWVATARVSRSWPGEVDVNISERVPAALAPDLAGSLALVDAQGRVLVWLPAPLPNVTVIEGLAPAGPPGTTMAAPAAGLLAVAAAVPASLRPQVAAVGLDPVDGIRLRLASGARVVVGTADDLAAKLRAAELVLSGVETTGMATLDVRVPATPTIVRG
jgi:cell division protein FtsQ